MSRRERCEEIISSAALKAGAVGFGFGGATGFKTADISATTVIQIRMIRDLGEVYGKEIKKTFAQSIITSYLSQEVGRTAVSFLSSKMPFAGKFINASCGASATEAIGWFTVETFEN